MTFDEACRAIESEFAVALGSPKRVAVACAALRGALPGGPDFEGAARLLPLLARRSGEIARPLFDLLEEKARTSSDPIPILTGLLDARDGALCGRALDVALELAEGGWLWADAQFVSVLAEKVEAEGNGFADALSLEKIDRIVRRAAIAEPRPGVEPRVDLYLKGASRPVRRLAARLLDLEAPPPPKRMAAVLGVSAYRFLAPYLAYAQATHLDLLEIAGEEGVPAPLLANLTAAEVILGERLLREVTIAVGWSRLNLGLDVRERIGLSVDDSFPFAVSPAEAALIESNSGVRRRWTRFLILAHGGDVRGEPREDSSESPVRRFRAYNLAHAEALAEILNVGPLSRERVERIVGMLDGIVEDFVALFSGIDDEAAALPAIYAALRGAVLSGAAGASGGALSAHVTRLTQMFEDPRSLAEVHTLHGLKRYLHQKGLRLGFRLVETGRATNRTLDLLLAGPEKVQATVRRIQYIEFEPEETGGTSETRIPYAVSIVAEGMGRHLLHGLATFPEVKIFCYGNEVHYFASYGTHPAFLRIDFAPPVRGGMIDLEYYGVSKHDLDHHPAPDLDAVRLFFRGMDYDCAVARTRVHARYDKERARDLGDLCAKAEGLFRLLPLLMDVDWVIGSLRLDDDARAQVATAWRDFFLHWGILPTEELLTADRLGILTGFAPDPAGGKEIPWPGRGAYRDRFSSGVPERFIPELRSALEGNDLSRVVPFINATPRAFGQLDLERILLQPLRDAVGRGELLEGPEGFQTATDLYRPEHEAETFATILAGDLAAIARSAALARLVGDIERSLRFHPTGTVNEYEVARADLALRGRDAAVYVLRDRSGMARLAIFASEGRLFWSRTTCHEAWRRNDVTDVAAVLPVVRRANYVPAGSPAAEADDPTAVRSIFAIPNPLRAGSSTAGERLIPGVRAAPGRATGPAMLGTRGRAPGDLDGAILVAATIRPDDNAFIYRSAGIVSTGGGILSHAGLLALQFHKPALLIDARWDEAGRSLVYRAADYEETRADVEGFAVVSRLNVREREERIMDGDILDLDVERGFLRNLGREPDALALHEGLRQMRSAARALERATDDARLLALRGQRLRARHQLERLLGRLTDPTLARHAVRELFLGAGATGGARGESAGLVARLIGNSSVAAATRDCVADVLRDLDGRYRDRALEARERIPASDDPHEILSLRLDAARARETLHSALRLAHATDLGNAPTPRVAEAPERELDDRARARLTAIRELWVREVDSAAAFLRRHLLRRIESLDPILDLPASNRGPVQARALKLDTEDQARRVELADRWILRAEDGGFELAPLIGMKAANLSEIERVLSAGVVPRWFVVTDAALRAILDRTLDLEGGPVPLREAIASILARDGADPSQKAFLIGKLWAAVRLPEAVETAIVDAYRDLVASQTAGPHESADGTFVAVRSSGREEDTEGAARAGEFDTFLFVRGERDLIDAVRRVWSGLWSARAIHNRAVLGDPAPGSGGGVLVQRICWSRVSGVLTTINVGEGRMREIVVNAALGLGEGLVSGEVGADLIVVAKQADLEEAPLRFRYLTNDKREKIVFDRKRGRGTIRVEALYHERFRPALEYVELCELVRAALCLEAVYGYPLDIEFGIEGDCLRILQARPLARTAAVLRETIDRHPLPVPRAGRGERKEIR